MKNLLVICGATATGKTALAVACAKALSSQVISADSQLIYRGLDIGTAKPTESERGGVVHHMIDIVPPDSSFSVSDYRAAALPMLRSIADGGKIPVVCGGTGFYINSLLFDYSYAGAAGNEEVRNKYRAILEEKGCDYLYGLLQQVDGRSAQTIHKNDTKRVIRALEIFEVSGRRKSELSDGKKSMFNYLAVAVDYPRDVLYSRIGARVEEMFGRGLVNEVRSLLSVGIDEKCQSMQAIGYKEILEGIRCGYSQSTMCDKIKQNTRHYAKRQLTFFKKLPGIVWLDYREASPEKILELLND